MNYEKTFKAKICTSCKLVERFSEFAKANYVPADTRVNESNPYSSKCLECYIYKCLVYVSEA